MKKTSLPVLLLLSLVPFAVATCADEAPEQPQQQTPADAGGENPPPDAGLEFPEPDAGTDAGTDVVPGDPIGVDDQQEVQIAVAEVSDEHALEVELASVSATGWDQDGNEALVLEVTRGATLIGHLVLHQGATPFVYGMHVGALAAGDAVSLKVSALSASAATRRALVTKATLTPASTLGERAEGLLNAPVFMWPVEKRFDDLPVALGWSKAKGQYHAVYTHENGGKDVDDCGNPLEQQVKETLSRVGRAFDMKPVYKLGTPARWLRCTGEINATDTTPRREAAHPIFYYGDGHNRLFENRGGYANNLACGLADHQMADGDLAGWNLNNPGNEPAKDAALTVVLRPLPLDLDALGYATDANRVEGIADTHIPWIYRLAHLELQREGRCIAPDCRPLGAYLYVDVLVSDVAGSGGVCTAGDNMGFTLSAVTNASKTLESPRVINEYFAGEDGAGWKRVAIPLDRVYAPSELKGVLLDAYTGDSILWHEIGDVFMVRALGDNGATLARVREGAKIVKGTNGVFVQDNPNMFFSCGPDDVNPIDGVDYPCSESFHQFNF